MTGSKPMQIFWLSEEESFQSWVANLNAPITLLLTNFTNKQCEEKHLTGEDIPDNTEKAAINLKPGSD